MMFGTPCEDYQVNPVIERAMDRIFILHADHEQNASTSTRAPVRLCRAPTPLPPLQRAWSARGPAHGGANEAWSEHAGRNPGHGRRVQGGRVHGKGQDKNSGVKLMGFGHRVYKNYDPRVKLMQETCNEVLPNWGWRTIPCLLSPELERSP